MLGDIVNKLFFNLENCYGIKKLEYSFDFSESHMMSIYASNGTMKTSFSRTFKDLSEGNDSKDLMFPERGTVREILDETNNPIAENQVFVIEPYNADFNEKKISTLLVNNELKTQYDNIHSNLNIKKNILLDGLSVYSGLKKEIEEEFMKVCPSNSTFYECLEYLNDFVSNHEYSYYSTIKYSEIFKPKVLLFLEDPDVRMKLNDYIEKYNALIDSSSYFRKGIFTHTNAQNVSKTLEKDGFFKADHHLVLNSIDNANESKIITDKNHFEDTIENEIGNIINNSELSQIFNEIDKKITKNQDLTSFRTYLEKNQSIIPELIDISGFRKKLWVSYLIAEKKLYRSLYDDYLRSKDEISTIIDNAQNEVEDWKNVIDIFNKRFSVPFTLIIQNQEDVILKNEVPTVYFDFKDSSDTKRVKDIGALLNVLSNGEKKALYILNIIFELESRKRNPIDHLFIFDDIADSFDYKNKYAIIEYIKEISEVGNFYSIVLTHNFDFYRTIEKRVVNRSNCYMTVKDNTKVELIAAQYLKPFEYFRNNYHHNDLIKIATIPFVRNIIEYTMGVSDSDYKMLTSILHIPINTSPVTMNDLDIIFNKTFNKNYFGNDETTFVKDKVYSLATSCLSHSDGINLEDKIVLSIAIRLKAEEFMIAKINDTNKINSINRNQTRELFNIYSSDFPHESNNISLLEQVHLITPENIHLNSFMYEPILDISDNHLRELYRDILNL